MLGGCCLCVCVWGFQVPRRTSGTPGHECSAYALNLLRSLKLPSSFSQLGRSSWPVCITTAVRIYATRLHADVLHAWKSARDIQQCLCVFSTKDRRRLVFTAGVMKYFIFHPPVCRGSKVIDQINIILNHSGCCQIRGLLKFSCWNKAIGYIWQWYLNIYSSNLTHVSPHLCPSELLTLFFFF